MASPVIRTESAEIPRPKKPKLAVASLRDVSLTQGSASPAQPPVSPVEFSSVSVRPRAEQSPALHPSQRRRKYATVASSNACTFVTGLTNTNATNVRGSQQQAVAPPGEWKCNSEPLQSYFKPTLGLNVEYYPQFFSRNDADAIFHRLDRELQPFLDNSTSELRMMGKVHKLPRKQAAFGDAGLVYHFSGMAVAANDWIPLLLKIRVCIENVLEKTFNFVLVNRYKDGSDHIGEHRDGEVDLCPESPIAAVSFGQPRDFVLRHKDSRGSNAPRKDIQPVKINLAHGSLLVMKPPTNHVWYHSLPARKNTPTPRISLTFRKMKVKSR